MTRTTGAAVGMPAACCVVAIGIIEFVLLRRGWGGRQTRESGLVMKPASVVPRQGALCHRDVTSATDRDFRVSEAATVTPSCRGHQALRQVQRRPRILQPHLLLG